MMEMLWLVVGALATWRLSSLIARERGLFGVGTWLRTTFGVHHDSDGTPAVDEDGNVLLNPITPLAAVDDLLHEIARGMTCIWCASVWVAFIVAAMLAVIAPPLVADFATLLLVSLALSAGAILLERLIER